MTARRYFSRLPPAFWVALGVPLAIALIAAWQWHRASPWPGDTATYLHVRSHGLRQYLAPLALLTLLAGVLATATSGVALLAMRHAAARALQSRDALLHAFESGRRWLPAFMLLQTLLVLGGLAGLLAFEVIHAFDQPAVSRNALKLTLLAALLALALLWYGARIAWDTLRFALRKPTPDPIEIMGQSLSPAQAPLLWEFVRDVAQRTGALLPDAVVVGLNEGFFVTEYPVVLSNGQPVPEGRVLYLPLPYMAFLDRAQVAAVVAHEVGHFTGEDTRYSLRFAPIQRTLADSILAITNEHDDDDDGWRTWLSAPASLCGKWFLRNFDEAMRHWSRERELAADAFSSRIAGTEPGRWPCCAARYCTN